MTGFFDILSSPGADVQTFTQPNSYHMWTKPRGAKHTYMLVVGGGGSGGCGLNSAATSGGGAGGGSGNHTIAYFPTFSLPNSLYIFCGQGGKQPAALVSGAAGVVGNASFVLLEPDSSQTKPTIVRASGATATGSATSTNGGTASSVVAAIVIAAMGCSSYGHFYSLASLAGGAGGSSTVDPTDVAWPVTGQFLTGGAGGGGTTGAAPRVGASVNIPTTPVGTDYFQKSTFGAAASGATPAGNGGSGFTGLLGHRFGGAGGGGASATGGGVAGAGGNGALGCGGGGAGGSNTTVTTLARPGNGGDGFVIIVSLS